MGQCLSTSFHVFPFNLPPSFHPHLFIYHPRLVRTRSQAVTRGTRWPLDPLGIWFSSYLNNGLTQIKKIVLSPDKKIGPQVHKKHFQTLNSNNFPLYSKPSRNLTFSTLAKTLIHNYKNPPITTLGTMGLCACPWSNCRILPESPWSRQTYQEHQIPIHPFSICHSAGTSLSEGGGWM